MMMGFYRHLAPYVSEGSKTHTIREGERWKVGMRADQYIEPRHTSPSELIQRVPVHKVERISLYLSKSTWSCTMETTFPINCAMCGAERVVGLHNCSQGPIVVRIAGHQLADDEASAFLWRDGFRENGVAGAQAMALEHWSKPLKRYGCVIGQLIHWLYEWRTNDIRGLDGVCDALVKDPSKVKGWKP